ncbi:MAG: hypothetical protein WDO73_37790 [Ignavibacteriota bacterium]
MHQAFLPAGVPLRAIRSAVLNTQAPIAERVPFHRIPCIQRTVTGLLAIGHVTQRAAEAFRHIGISDQHTGMTNVSSRESDEEVRNPHNSTSNRYHRARRFAQIAYALVRNRPPIPDLGASTDHHQVGLPG